MNNFSIVIPIFNEQDNIIKLYEEICSSIKDKNLYEIIFVNDGSFDNSKNILNLLKEEKKIVLVNNKNKCGQSFSILSGIRASSYNAIVTIDGDCQNNPRDIQKLAKIYFANDDVFLVGGIRTNRKDNYIKIISSIIANRIRSAILKDNCIDTGCSLKIFDKNIFLNFPFFDGIHRFLPALFKGFGLKTHFVSVDHRARLEGKSKYGTFDRLFNGSVEEVALKSYSAKLQIKKQREELKNWIVGHYGLAGWENLLREEGRIRKQRAEAVYKIEEQKRKIRDYSIMGFAILIGLLAIGWMVWLVSMDVSSR